MLNKLAVTDHILNFKNKLNCTQNPFLPKRKKKMDAKHFKMCMRLVFISSLPKNDVNLQKKTKTMSQVGVQKLACQFFLQQLSYMVHLNIYFCTLLISVLLLGSCDFTFLKKNVFRQNTRNILSSWRPLFPLCEKGTLFW